MELSENEIIVLNYSLTYFPYYGDFSIINKMIEGEKNKPIAGQLAIAFVLANKSNIYEYLIDNGFAIKRNDISGNKTQSELTERGRKLKALGVLSEFHNNEVREAEDIRSVQIDRKMEILRSERQLWVNFSLAISTGVAAVYYLFALTDFFQHHSVSWQHVAYLLVGVGIGLCIGLLLPRLISVIKKARYR